MDFIYKDNSIVVCLKPRGVLSTDEPGGLPELIRNEIGENECVRTVHRLDRVVGGLMVLARSGEAASILSEQIRKQELGKAYLAVTHGEILRERGRMTDLLRRDKAERKTYVTGTPGPDAREAILDYELLGRSGGMSLVRIELLTGRTHQIRAQFSSRGFPLVGDRKYGDPEEKCGIALWSCFLEFRHPRSGRTLRFSAPPPDIYPWNVFDIQI
ncbi:MAG: RluA family pseudouridine synthase [Candidatus Heteroscillospira sp.]